MDIKMARAIAKQYGVNVNKRPFLLSKPLDNPKVAKNLKQGYLTAPLHLIPSDLSGFNVCQHASEGCRKACLHTAGNPAYFKGKNKARKAKTRFFFLAREAFLTLLIEDMRWLASKAESMGYKAGVRLNATSDLPWERIKLNGIDMISHARQCNILPYDYAKSLTRALKQPYHLTLSRTEDNDSDCIKALQSGINVAAVFKTLPDTWNGFPVIDGDKTDLRPFDGKGVVVGLKAKGKAKTDSTNFVIQYH